MSTLASIDVGTLTARLLISREDEGPHLFSPVLRKRAYIRLAEDFDTENRARLQPAAIRRALSVLEDFAVVTRAHHVDMTRAVSTGVMRRATNKEDLLVPVFNNTGIRVKVISGEEEARLTGEGVAHFLKLPDRPFMVFDLGGGSTEFILGNSLNGKARSIPLGAMILTDQYFQSDPPEEKSEKALADHVDRTLQETFTGRPGFYEGEGLVATGGTVTTLAAMFHGLKRSEINPDRMNGLILKREDIEALFSRMRKMTVSERSNLDLLDEDRARVILAGTLIVIRILHFFKSNQIIVSLSDILEGLLVDYLKGVNDGTKGY